MKDEIINIIKEAMGENYKKVLWIFQEHIKNLINCYPSNENGLVFEYKSRISSKFIFKCPNCSRKNRKVFYAF
ncbi:hypothetical protein LZX05_08215 [Campylobacter coli]|nr:hypothetical protein [Campylobacter coli]